MLDNDLSREAFSTIALKMVPNTLKSIGKDLKAVEYRLEEALTGLDPIIDKVLKMDKENPAKDAKKLIEDLKSDLKERTQKFNRDRLSIFQKV